MNLLSSDPTIGIRATGLIEPRYQRVAHGDYYPIIQPLHQKYERSSHDVRGIGKDSACYLSYVKDARVRGSHQTRNSTNSTAIIQTGGETGKTTGRSAEWKECQTRCGKCVTVLGGHTIARRRFLRTHPPLPTCSQGSRQDSDATVAHTATVHVHRCLRRMPERIRAACLSVPLDRA